MGYKHTDKSLKKMRNFILSNKVLAKKRLTPKNATSSRRIPILVENIKTGNKFEFRSFTETGHALGVSRAAVSQALIKNRILNKIYCVKKNINYIIRKWIINGMLK